MTRTAATAPFDMWIFTRYGFFSVVCARGGDGPGGRLDLARVMVRARLRSHLEDLRQQYPDLLGPCEIHASPDADYAFRMFMAKAAWADVLSRLGSETDYGNFKSEVARRLGRRGAAYEQALHRIWSIMYRLQQ